MVSTSTLVAAMVGVAAAVAYNMLYASSGGAAGYSWNGAHAIAPFDFPDGCAPLPDLIAAQASASSASTAFRNAVKTHVRAPPLALVPRFFANPRSSNLTRPSSGRPRGPVPAAPRRAGDGDDDTVYGEDGGQRRVGAVFARVAAPERDGAQRRS